MSVGRGTKFTIRIGTRSSRLARWQADWVADQLRNAHPELTVELVEIKTQGDRDQDSPLAAIGGIGVFTKEIQRAVLEKRVDLAVHSLKDLPTQQVDGLLLAAVPAREDPADALIAPRFKMLDGLPPSARVGTGSPRRLAQLRFLRPDLEIVSLRGNVETRLRHALEGRLDAVVLACAGLRRLGLADCITERLDAPRFLPAVGQGALGLECRSGDTEVVALIKFLNDSSTYRAVLAERALLAMFQGGCTLPLAAWARDVIGAGTERTDATLAIDAAFYSPDGRERVVVSLDGSPHDPEGLGRRAAQTLLGKGAGVLVAKMDLPFEH